MSPKNILLARYIPEMSPAVDRMKEWCCLVAEKKPYDSTIVSSNTSRLGSKSPSCC
jgi:hypothetical protein